MCPEGPQLTHVDSCGLLPPTMVELLPSFSLRNFGSFFSPLLQLAKVDHLNPLVNIGRPAAWLARH